MCAQIAAARRELVRELLRARRSALPLALDWSCPSISGSSASIASLQLAPGAGALTFAPRERDGSLAAPERDYPRFAVAGWPCVAIDGLELLPSDVRWVDPVGPCEPAVAEVRQHWCFRTLHPRLL